MRATELVIPGFDAVYRLDNPTGFIALHRCRRAPAFGGTRIREYAAEDDALRDALRLAEAMTCKYAINELPFGGGKAVLVQQTIHDRARALRALGDFIESLAGTFISGSDLGVTEADVQVMATRTRYIECRDGSEATSASVFHAMRATLGFCRGSESMTRRTVAIQGAGAVGSRLAARCIEAGARVVVADVDAARVAALQQRLGVESCPPQEILQLATDIVAPCAVGGVIRSDDVDSLRCSILCGGANNMLDRGDTAELLAARGITYVPDFLANSGAAIEGAWTQLSGPGEYGAQIAAVGERVRDLLADAKRQGISPLAAALRRIAA